VGLEENAAATAWSAVPEGAPTRAATGSAFPFPWPLPVLLPPWLVPIINPCLHEPTLCMPRPSPTLAFLLAPNDTEPGAVAGKLRPAGVPGEMAGSSTSEWIRLNDELLFDFS
jgi:hypothetical protein